MILYGKQRSVEWARIGYYGGQTLDGALATLAANEADKVIVQAWDNRPEPTLSLTAAELDRRVSSASDSLLDLGLKQDDPVLIQIAPRIHTIVALLAAARANLIALPVPGIAGRAALRDLMSRTRARAAIVDLSPGTASTPKAMIEATADVFEMRFLLSLGGTAPDGVLPLDAAFEGKALSGEAGKPLPRAERPSDHVAMLWPQHDAEDAPLLARSHNELLAAGLSVVLACGLSGEDALFSPLLPQRLSGLASTIMPWLLTGATLNIAAPQDWRAIGQSLKKPFEGRKLVILPGKIAAMAVHTLPSEAEVVRVWNDPLSADTAPHGVQNDARILADLVNIGECGLAVSPRGATVGAIPIAEWRTEENGLPPFIDARLAGSIEKASDLPQRNGLIRGEIHLRGPGTPVAPWPAPESRSAAKGDAARFAGEYFKTGLRGHMADGPDGPEIRVIGDVNAVKRTGARSYNLGMLDRAYQKVPGISDAAAFEIPDELLGTRIGAAIVPVGEPPSMDVLRRQLIDSGLSLHLLPTEITVLAAIPRTKDGVINRDALVIDRIAV